MVSHLVKQLLILSGDITLIEVIAHDECLKRHPLEVSRYGMESAYPLQTDGICRQRSEPVERSDCLRHLWRSDHEPLLAFLAHISLLAIAMKDSDLVPSEKAECLDLIDGIPLCYECEQIAQLLLS